MLICCQSTLRVLARPIARNRSAVCSSKQGANGLGLVLKKHTLTPTQMQTSTHSAGGKKPLECFCFSLRGHREDDMTKMD